jgi:hypothetical protein
VKVVEQRGDIMTKSKFTKSEKIGFGIDRVKKGGNAVVFVEALCF